MCITKNLQIGKYEELRQYFDELDSKAAAPLSFSDCENKAIRYVLNLETGKLRKDMKLEYLIEAGANLGIKDLDISTVLMNLIDNAIEACERDMLENAVISLKIKDGGSYVFITVTNPVSNAETTMRLFEEGTSKQDVKRHGYGKQIVSAIAEKHNGAIKYSAEDGLFRADVMLEKDEQNE